MLLKLMPEREDGTSSNRVEDCLHERHPDAIMNVKKILFVKRIFERGYM
jgi:hypothetical protein